MQHQAGNLDFLEEIKYEVLQRFLFLDKGWRVRTSDAEIGYTVNIGVASMEQVRRRGPLLKPAGRAQPGLARARRPSGDRAGYRPGRNRQRALTGCGFGRNYLAGAGAGAACCVCAWCWAASFWAASFLLA